MFRRYGRRSQDPGLVRRWCSRPLLEIVRTQLGHRQRLVRLGRQLGAGGGDGRRDLGKVSILIVGLVRMITMKNGELTLSWSCWAWGNWLALVEFILRVFDMIENFLHDWLCKVSRGGQGKGRRESLGSRATAVISKKVGGEVTVET
jgi:hypothetical protein